MPYQLQVDDVVQVLYWSRLFEQRCLVTCHYAVTQIQAGNDGPTEILNLLQQIGDPAVGQFSALLACQTPQVVYSYITGQRVYATRQAMVTRSIPATPGTRPGDCETPNVAAYLERATDLATARKQKLKKGQVGGVHICGVATTDYAGGLFSGAFVTGPLIALGSELRTSILTPGGTNFRPCLFHSRSNPVSYTLITQTTPYQEVRTMRRRTVGRGV